MRTEGANRGVYDGVSPLARTSYRWSMLTPWLTGAMGLGGMLAWFGGTTLEWIAPDVLAAPWWKVL